MCHVGFSINKLLIFSKKHVSGAQPTMKLILITTVIVILICDFSVSERTELRKCCPTNHFLSENKTSCVTLYDLYEFPENLPTRYDFVVPLAVSGTGIYLRHGFVNDSSDYCVDKVLSLDNGQPITDVHIDAVESSEPMKKIRTIQKCCPNGYVYDLSQHYCTQNFTEPEFWEFILNLYDDQPRFVDFKIGIVNCQQAVLELVNDDHFFSITDDLLVVKDKRNQQEMFTRGSYCLDDTTDGRILAKVCRSKTVTCRSHVCINKCCPDGQDFIKPKSGGKPKCMESAKFASFNPGLISIAPNGSIQPAYVDTFAVIPNYTCTRGRFVMSEDEGDLSKTHHGKMYLYDDKIYPNPISAYCIENVESKSFKGLKKFQCFPEWLPNEAEESKKKKRLFFYSGALFISCLFLLATLLVYLCLPELQNLHGKTLMCHVLCMLLGDVTLGVMQINILPLETSNGLQLCQIAGYIIIYMFLAAFSWLNIMCFDIWWTFGGTRSVGGSLHRRNLERRRFLLYNTYAWTFPSIIVTMIFCTDHFKLLSNEYLPNIGFLTCFFDFSTYGYFIFFSIPVAIQSACNLVLFVLTAIHCSRIKAEIHRMQASANSNHKKKRFVNDKAKLAMNLKLFIVMGISWIYESLGMYNQNLILLWYLGDIFNCLLGIPIFYIFVVKSNILNLLRTRLGIRQPNQPPTTSTTSDQSRSKLSISSARASTTLNPATIKQLTEISEKAMINGKRKV